MNKVKGLAILILVVMFSTTAYAAELSDISGHTNEVAIRYLFDNGVIQGYPDGTFKPENTVNRAELLKILIGGKNISPTVEEYNNCFSDVADEWFAPWVCYAKTEGWVEGYADGTFKPANEVNKVEAIKMLVESQGYTLPSTLPSTPLFDDVSSDQWFSKYISVAKDKGLLEEISGNYNPAAYKTRASISENIYRAMIIKEEALNSFYEYNPNAKIIELNGSKTNVTKTFGLDEGLAIIKVTHSGSSNFILKLLGSDGGFTEYVFNEIGDFNGEKALFVPKNGDYLFDVDADGAWTIKIEQPGVVSSAQPLRTFSGSGMTVTDFFTLDNALTVINLTHSGKSNFIVYEMNVTSGTESIYSNAIGDYEGSTVAQPKSGIHLFSVDADGDWTIKIKQYTNFDNIPVKTSFSGVGDTATELFTLNGGLKTFHLTHDGSSNFIVYLVDKSGATKSYLTNEIGEFDGSTAENLESNVYLFNVQADGNWTIDIN